MTTSEPIGCLGAILALFGIRRRTRGDEGSPLQLPYRVRDDFLSAAELSFYQVLAGAIGRRAVICPKVNLSDLFFVVRPHENAGSRNQINRKHVDFLLCSPTTLQPLCGIELDDSSHARADRQQRDRFVDQVFEAADLPLVRIPVRSTYSPARLLELMEPHLNRSSPQGVPASQFSESIPRCPKCRVPMVERQVSKGEKAGNRFWGCANYPKCRQVQDWIN